MNSQKKTNEEERQRANTAVLMDAPPHAEYVGIEKERHPPDAHSRLMHAPADMYLSK